LAAGPSSVFGEQHRYRHPIGPRQTSGAASARPSSGGSDPHIPRRLAWPASCSATAVDQLHRARDNDPHRDHSPRRPRPIRRARRLSADGHRRAVAGQDNVDPRPGRSPCLRVSHCVPQRG
jgi:hypothetical protein